eukprot:gene9841-13236_t
MFDDLRPELSIYGRDHMITPNFERLAKKSVIFDYAYSQISVCNPSRDSLLTGLRPDTVGTYNFQHSYQPHLLLPSYFARSGYNTAGVGKIMHWESSDKNIWNYDHWSNDWYIYQNYERGIMNSSTMPDKVKPEEKFRDYEFTSKAIDILKRLLKFQKYYMLAIGYKLPHLAVHVPYKYYEMYKGKSQAWKLTKKEMKFPLSAPEVSYRGCAELEFKYMREEGALPSNRSAPIGDITTAFTDEMHDELMIGYVAAVTFVDKQVGRLLDVLDEYNLWNNLTVVLTADHGMHNGEKGIWEKWTLFEESTRVPLMISHPQSPFQGEHYKQPVELVDVFPTIRDLVKAPADMNKICKKPIKCVPLSGKSLAPIILGDSIYKSNFNSSEPSEINYYVKSTAILDQRRPLLRGSISNQSSEIINNNSYITIDSNSNYLTDSPIMPIMYHNFAISQMVRCAPKEKVRQVQEFKAKYGKSGHKPERTPVWGDCDRFQTKIEEVQLMGYAIRTPEYRYIVYFNYDKLKSIVDLDSQPYAQELYDHKNETLADFTHRETYNLAIKPAYNVITNILRAKLLSFLKEKVIFSYNKKERIKKPANSVKLDRFTLPEIKMSLSKNRNSTKT